MSNNLTVNDLHLIRHENYEQTKGLSDDELMKRTRDNALAGWQRIEQIHNDRLNKEKELVTR